MRTRGAHSFVLVLMTLSLSSAGMVACYINGSDGGYGVSTGSGDESAGAGGTTGSSGAGASPNAPTTPSDPPGEDAGAQQGELTCDKLDKSKPLVLYLSADDSNSMGSPAHAREMLSLGVKPNPDKIRTYEFLNYYRIQYPAPPQGQLALFPELGQGSDPSELDFQIAVRSFDAPMPRRPMTITFVVDTSGSMKGPGLERAQATIKAIAQSLSKGDLVNVVTWSTDNNVVLSGYSVTGPNDSELIALADALVANGGTDLHSGLVAGYDLASKHYGPSRINRVILISDGGANVGEVDAEFIGQKSKDADQEGIYLVGVGTGPALSYNDSLMDVVTDKGRGAYIYLDNVMEAKRVFADRFDETMEIAARGVQLELTLPWYFQMHRFYGEEYSENAAEIEPQHLAPSDAMIFNQVLKACDASMINPDDTITVRAKWKTPISYVAQKTEVTTTVKALLEGDKSGLPKGKAIVAYAEALKSPSKESLAKAHEAVLAANPSGTDPELNEIATLIEIHPQY